MGKTEELPETGCCARFDPKPWDRKEIVWKDRIFIKDHVRCFLRMPLDFEKVLLRNMDKIKAAGAQGGPLMLSDENSLWGSDLYIAATKEVPGADNVRISGTFLSRVYEGPYQDIGKWIKDMEDYVKTKRKDMKRLFFYYTTCPKCAKAYGKNYVVLLAEI